MEDDYHFFQCKNIKTIRLYYCDGRLCLPLSGCSIVIMGTGKFKKGLRLT